MLRQIVSQARKHPSFSVVFLLISLFLFIGAGGTGAALCLTRLALLNLGVSWDQNSNPEPWNKLGPTEQYKFYSLNVDDSKLRRGGPDF
ncbi:PREDICTED: cytochrome c oxidase subunit NDUFA4-like [Chinchilla lanigera]|uniref:cytochrome c oxidase subunit NDUFA4-like n=1 Tax=Chinchilla lanigera TaxID=34839 RepID=UPI00038F0D00|nr:PREDICTED: cytochrome c oxidase subunit NDUFA4-like [Chinchilla lanigera]